jgi:hypothetical protein
MRRPAFGVASATAIAVIALCAVAAPYTVDDAFIVLRYAQNLARGAGYALNPGERSDGVTGPLWLFVPVFAELLRVPPLPALKLAGALSAAGAAWLAIAWQRQRALGRGAAWASASVLVCLPDYTTWAVAGLETALATLVLVGLAIATLGRPRARARLAGGLLAAIAWLRPELMPAALVLWLALARRGARVEHRALIASAAIAAAGIGALLAWRFAMFGDWLPLSARAKPADLGRGFDYVAHSILLATSGVGAGLVCLAAVRGGRRERWLCAACLVHAGSVVLAGGDWMPGARLMTPVLPFYALLAGRGAWLVGWRPSVREEHKKRALTRLVAIGMLGFSCIFPLFDLATRGAEQRASALSRATGGAALAAYLRKNTRRVALLDAGYLPYASGVYAIDLGGLTDPRIARLAGGHIDKHIDEALLRARDPDAIVLHSASVPRVDAEGRLRAFDGYPVEQRIARMPFVREHFRVARYFEYAPSYGYVVLARIPKR